MRMVKVMMKKNNMMILMTCRSPLLLVMVA